MAEQEKRILIIHEAVRDSWLKDAGTFAMVLALIGIGIALDSAAMQWVGAIMAILAVMHRASEFRRQNTFDVADARARLDEIEALA